MSAAFQELKDSGRVVLDRKLMPHQFQQKFVQNFCKWMIDTCDDSELETVGALDIQFARQDDQKWLVTLQFLPEHGAMCRNDH